MLKDNKYIIHINNILQRQRRIIQQLRKQQEVLMQLLETLIEEMSHPYDHQAAYRNKVLNDILKQLNK